MKVLKNSLSLLLLFLVMGLAIFALIPDRQEDVRTAESTLPQANVEPISEAISPVEEQAPQVPPTSFMPVFEAVCDLHKNNWLLGEIEEDEAEMDSDTANESPAHINEIVEIVEKTVHSPEFAILPEKEEKAEMEESGIIEGRIEKGDTISTILEKSTSGSVQHFIRAAKKIFSLNSFKEGQPYLVHIDPESGKIQRFEYEINNKHKLVVEGGEKVQARLEDIEYTTLLDSVSSVIGDNLFKAVADIGESPELALSLVKLFGSEINFSRNLDKDDPFSVLIEKRYRDGEYKGYGRIIAAFFTNRGKTYEAFLFRDGTGKETYYNAEGQNLNKTLLQSPLAVTRMTSRFSHSRFHPILRETRPHLGVDYGAPTGTPVKAVGDGVVIERGWAGGYGNQLVIKHAAGLESLYSHLSGFARGMVPGEKVKQGQVIGFVGSTGLATGPHLDFRLRQNGEFINPQKAINPRGMPVAEVNMKAFEETRKKALACLNGERVFDIYNVDSIVPLKVISVKEEIIAEDEDAPTRYGRGKFRRLDKTRRAYATRRAQIRHMRRRR